MREVRRAILSRTSYACNVLSGIVTECAGGPGGGFLLQQIDAHYAFSATQRSHFLEGEPVSIWALPSLVARASTQELAAALDGALTRANAMSVWFIFRRIGQTGEHLDLAAATIKEWIWYNHPCVDSLSAIFPLRMDMLPALLESASQSRVLAARLRCHRDYPSMCWNLLVRAVTRGELEIVRNIIDVGVPPLQDEPNLLILASDADNTEILLELCLDDSISDKYETGMRNAPSRLSWKRKIQLARCRVWAFYRRLTTM